MVSAVTPVWSETKKTVLRFNGTLYLGGGEGSVPLEPLRGKSRLPGMIAARKLW
jgi:hypothetical protein